VSNYSNTVLADHPIAYYRLDEAAGLVAFDSSGNGNNGTISASGITLAQPGALTTDNDTAMLFTTSSGAVTLPTALNANGQNALTVECWIIPTAVQPAAAALWILGNGPQVGNAGYLLFVDSSPFLTFAAYNGTAGALASIRHPFGPGNTYHIVGTYDGKNTRLYVNGVLKATSAVVWGPISNAGTPSISAATANFFPGTIDEYALYNAVLPPERVQAHYVAGLLPLTIGMERPRYILRGLTNRIFTPFAAIPAWVDRALGSNFVRQTSPTNIPRYVRRGLSSLLLNYGLNISTRFRLGLLKDIATRFRLANLKDIATRFNLAKLNDIVTRFRLMSANQFKDIATRLRLARVNDVATRFRLAKLNDIKTRFRLMSANQLKDITTRFRLMSANQLKDIASRFRLMQQSLRDISTRFRLANLNDIATRFRLAKLNDVKTRFRLMSANQLKDIATRFRLMSANQLRDITTRFRLAKLNDIATRFRLAVANQSVRDIALRFRLMSANQLKDVKTRFRLMSANQMRDIALRFILATVGTIKTKDIACRFVLFAPADVVWVTRDGKATWVTRDGKATWVTRDDKVTWTTRR